MRSGAFMQRSSSLSFSDPFQMGSDAFRSNGSQFSASRIHPRWDLLLSKAAVLNFQLFGSIPNGIWCIQKQRITIFSFSDLFQMASGAFENKGPQFSASRIQSEWDLVHSNASLLLFSASRIYSGWALVHLRAAVLNFQLLGSIPYEI